MKGIYIEFSAGRRDGGSMDCIVCGTPIHQREAPGLPNPDAPWYDGHGETSGLEHRDAGFAVHDHAPAPVEGPTMGPFEFDYVQITYDSIRHEGETLASWDAGRGDWIVETGDRAGEAYSDITITLREVPA